MRIYEISPFFHIDLGKVVAIRQFIDKHPKGRDRNDRQAYDYWVEVTIDSGRHINIDCSSLETLENTHAMLLKAWQHYLGDVDEPAPQVSILQTSALQAQTR